MILHLGAKNGTLLLLHDFLIAVYDLFLLEGGLLLKFLHGTIKQLPHVVEYTFSSTLLNALLQFSHLSTVRLLLANLPYALVKAF